MLLRVAVISQFIILYWVVRLQKHFIQCIQRSNSVAFGSFYAPQDLAFVSKNFCAENQTQYKLHSPLQSHVKLSLVTNTELNLPYFIFHLYPWKTLNLIFMIEVSIIPWDKTGPTKQWMTFEIIQLRSHTKRNPRNPHLFQV